MVYCDPSTILQRCHEPRTNLLQGTHNVANLQKIMTRIGGVCLVTIGIWCIIELAVQFGHYGHSCKLGEGAPAVLLST